MGSVTETAISQLLTPALLLDEKVMQANIEGMRRKLANTVKPAGQALVLRPHVKTAKSLPVIEQMVAGVAEPRLTVSTLREASEVVGAGYKDVLYAVGVVPQKLMELKRLAHRSQARISVILDSREMAQALIETQSSEPFEAPAFNGEQTAPHAVPAGARLDAYIELDVDDHRAGVAPEGAELLEIGRILARGRGNGAKDEASLLRGVMTHAGGAYDCRSLQELEAMAERERAGAVSAAEALRADGLGCGEVSIGSTPTAQVARSFKGVTEVRVGVYVFNDLAMVGLGVCQPEQIAIRVLSTVIGHQPGRNVLLIDAGWMALSSDRSTANHAVDQGLGQLVCGNHDLIVSQANQEHGLVVSRSGSPIDFSRYPIGSHVQVLPVHACATAAQFDRYYRTRAETNPHQQGAVPTEVSNQLPFWPRFGGWRI